MMDVSGGSSAHPILHRPGLVAGIGLRAGATEADLLALLDISLAAAHARRSDLVALATLDKRADHPALAALAKTLGVPVLSLAADDLEQVVPNPSMRVAELAATPSVAEAAALVFGPLRIEKQRSANATCALSRYEPNAAGRSSAVIAASTVPTSTAGP